eukprot:m.120276 g.120276  ORF g.120276 m.120276 type:complete len:448 (+) comp14551_c1_seq1:541-1884(+)
MVRTGTGASRTGRPGWQQGVCHVAARPHRLHFFVPDPRPPIGLSVPLFLARNTTDMMLTLASLLVGLLCLSGTPVTQAQILDNPVLKPNVVSAAATAAFWTPERMRAAQPLTMPVATQPAGGAGPAPAAPAAGADGAGNASSFVGYSGVPPSRPITPNTTSIFTPSIRNATTTFAAGGAAVPAASGPTLYYTSSRLIPLSADLSWPHTTIGVLYFFAAASTGVPNPGFKQCSASVVGVRVLLTAGHCVHSGKNGQAGWYSNFLFVPATRDGAEPFGRWTMRNVAVTGTWYSGGGGVPNAADYAALVLNDNAGVPVGARVGWLGMALGVVSPNLITQFGYPCNIDNCAKMHRVDTSSSVFGGNNCYQYGSDMTGGASGGPWIQNFGLPGSGQPAPWYSGRTLVNAVVGVTSYGPSNPNTDRYLGASNLDSRVTSTINLACGTIPACWR